LDRFVSRQNDQARMAIKWKLFEMLTL